MDKIIEFPGRTERGIFTYVIDTEHQHLLKTAGEYHPTVAAYINSAKPIPGRTQVLLTALGAGEYWGFNKNGDYFPEAALAHPGLDYGYETFTKFGRVYRHHINKPTSESFGEVLLSVYNQVYHRVELIVALRHDNASDLVERLNNGEPLDVSMGTKVPYDVCSICGNRAPTRKQYCDHLKYYLGKIPPGLSRFAYAINTMPKFFDISFVLIGADRIAKTLKKVANYEEHNGIYVSSALLAEKRAENKQAEIKKEIPADSGEPPASQDLALKATGLAHAISEVKAMEPPLPPSLLNNLGERPLNRVLSTMTMLGILPKPQEFQRIVLVGMGHRNLADDLDRRNLCFDPMSVEEPSRETLRQISLEPHHFDPVIMEKLRPYVEDRSYAEPILKKRLIIMVKEGMEYPQPEYIKISAEDVKKERKPFGPLLPLLAAAGLYAALAKKAPGESLKGIDKLLSSTTGLGLATVLGLGAIKAFTNVAKPELKGHYSNGPYISSDVNDMRSRIEQQEQKPYIKVGAMMGPTSKRLFLGIPLAYMASGVLQKQREISPYNEEGRVKRFVRQNPDAISAALLADAALSAHNHPISSKRILEAVTSKAKTAKIPKLASEEATEPKNHTHNFLASSVIWPLAMGTKNLPQRMVGGLLDQSILAAGAAARKRYKEKHLSTPGNSG